MSEIDLLIQFRNTGSEDAFHQLVRIYAGLVYSVAKRRSSSATLAEDIAQKVFIRLAKAPPNVTTSSALTAWLHRTTLNTTIDLWRSESRRRQREEQAFLMQNVTPDANVWEEIAARLDEAIDQLNDEERRVILLRFFDRKPMRDVGAVLGISEDAAKMRVSRAVERLRGQLGVASASVLGALLVDKAVEAAPGPLVATLTAMKVSVATGGFLQVLLNGSKVNLVAGFVGVMLVGVGTAYLARSANHGLMPVPESNPASATDRLFSRLERGGEGARSAVSNPAPVRMLLHVLDSQEKPIPGASVHVASFNDAGLGESSDGLTDESGSFAILEPRDPAKKKIMVVFVSHEGHVPRSASFAKRDSISEFAIKLEDGLPMGGWVVDELDRPVGGVTIAIGNVNQMESFKRRENVDFQTVNIVTKADGSWRCRIIPKDFTSVPLTLSKAGFALTPICLPLVRMDREEAVLVIEKGYTVTGSVMDDQQHPVMDASIFIVGRNGRTESSIKTDADGCFKFVGVRGNSDIQMGGARTTTANGLFRFTGVRNSDQPYTVLAVQAESYAAQSQRVYVSDQTNPVSFTLQPGFDFRARVVDESGSPIAHAIIRTDSHIIKKGSSPFDWISQPAQYDWVSQSDNEGRFEWVSAPPEELGYWISADGYVSSRALSLRADGTEHVITLTRGSNDDFEQMWRQSGGGL